MQPTLGKAGKAALTICLVTGLLTVAACGGGSSSGSSDTKQLDLKLSGVYPEKHYLAENGPQYFAKQIKKRSHGHIKISYYAAKQLGDVDEQTDILKQGAADIAATIPGYLTSQMPLSEAFAMPRAFKKEKLGGLAYQRVATDKHSAVYKTDFARHHLVPLFTAVTGHYEMMTTKKPIHSIDDFKGLKVRSSGGLSDKIIKALGGSPTPVTSGDIHSALERGTVDANLQGISGAVGNSLQEVIKHVTTNASLTSFMSAWTMSKSKFDSLSHKDQKLLLQVGQQTAEHLAAEGPEASKQAFQKMKKAGVQEVTLNKADLKRLNADLRPVQTDWLGRMKKKGISGDKAITEMKESLKKERSEE
jgi:TRAP-type C4-dicarboxylate transport system substrate-binding protein